MGNRNKERLFRMKRFNVRHSKSANKVGVDGVLIGAWADVSGAQEILDAGCGCGLIALMLAQRNSEARILGIEIDKDAVEEAKENVSQSRWTDRIDIQEQDFQTINGKFDIIVSNPPFFHAGLNMHEDSTRALARHAGSLSPETILERSTELLNKGGRISFIAQYDSEDNLSKKSMEVGLLLARLTRVKGTINGPIKRILMEFELPDRKEELRMTEINELVIELSPGHYSEEYMNLCREFYTIF